MRNSFFCSQSTAKHTFLLLSFLILITMTVFGTISNYSNYIIFPIWALWMYVFITSTIAFSKNERTFVRASFILLAIMLLYLLIGYSSPAMGWHLRMVNWILMGITAVYAIGLFSGRELAVIYIVSFIAIILFVLFIIYGGLAIMAIDGEDEAANISRAWIGALFMLLSGLSLIVFLHVKKWFCRIIAVIVLLLSLFLNFSILQRGTNVIFTIAEIGLIIAFTLKRKALVYTLSTIIILLAIYIYSTGLLVDILDWLADVIPSNRVAIRIREISTALYYEDINASYGSLSGRSRLIGISWDTFTSSIGHFIFGAGEQTRNNIIGHHSFVTDMLARYGIIGGTVLFVYYKNQFQIMMSYLDKKTDWALYMQCAIVFLMYIARSFYGDMAFAFVNLVLLVFFPLTFQIINYYKRID